MKCKECDFWGGKDSSNAVVAICKGIKRQNKDYQFQRDSISISGINCDESFVVTGLDFSCVLFKQKKK